MAIKNPIQYVSRDFSTVLSDINSDAELASKPSWWKRIWAGIADVISVWVNSIANLLFLRTAYTRGAVEDHCALIDYVLRSQTTSNGSMLFQFRTDLGPSMFPFTVSAQNLSARSEGNQSSSSKRFEARAPQTFTLGAYNVFTHPYQFLGYPNIATQEIELRLENSQPASFFDFLHTGHKVQFLNSGYPAWGGIPINTDLYVIYISPKYIKLASSVENAMAGIPVTISADPGYPIILGLQYSGEVNLFQQQSLENPVVLGKSDGLTAWQEFSVPDAFMLPDTISLQIGPDTWTKVSSFVDYTGTSKVFKVIPKRDNTFAVRFGDGNYGAIPGSFDIYANYAIGGGQSSNIPGTNYIVNYAGGDSKITRCFNVTPFNGGSDEEDIESAKKLAPVLLKAQARFIEAEDGEALALAYGGLSYVKVWPNYFGPLSCKVVAIANGGGNPSTALRSDIQTYLESISILDNVDVHFDLGVFVAVDVDAQIKVLPGYVFTNGVDKYVNLAFRLFLSSTGYELLSIYNSQGIGPAVTYINGIHGTSFGSSDYPVIETMVRNLPVRNFGETIQESDVLGYIDSYVQGVDYLTVTIFGSGFPLAFAEDEIADPGTITLSEIV